MTLGYARAGLLFVLGLLLAPLLVALCGCEKVDPATYPENIVQSQIGGVCERSPRSYVDVECAKDGQLLFCNLVRGRAGCWVPATTGQAAER